MVAFDILRSSSSKDAFSWFLAEKRRPFLIFCN